MRSLAFVPILVLAMPAAARTPEASPGGALEVVVDGQVVSLPLLKTDADVEVHGDLSTVRLVQRFANPLGPSTEARYVFPLPPDAAVYAMKLTTADEVIEAKIQEKAAAEATFAAAKAEGKQAALLAQERPNVFVQRIAHLVPGAPVEVELRYAHVVPRRDGAYELHLPLVVGPRYVAPQSAGDGEPAPLPANEWTLPASAPVAAPKTVDRERVGLRVLLQAGVPVRAVESPSHPIEVSELGERMRHVVLASGRTLDDRDFVLRYRLAGEAIAAGVTAHAGKEGAFVSLLVEPPSHLEGERVTPRELVFVLDCSGSMAGVPLEASKRFMRQALRGLRPTDSFRVIRFSDGATAFSKAPLPATAANVREGLAYVDGLDAEGGTDMSSGIRAALDPVVPAGALRVVVFLTDGYIGSDAAVVRLVEQRRGEARLFAFGIGASVNRWLLEELGRVGRGDARIVLPDEDAGEAADLLANRLEAPVLTDLAVDWGGGPFAEATPAALPDLFLGDSVRVVARATKPGTYRVHVHGKVAGKPVRLPLDVTVPSAGGAPGGEALPIVWARGQIEDRMQRWGAPSRTAEERSKLEAEVTRLGLDHRLVTRWTSFVAVARKVVVPSGASTPADVAVPQVHGVPGAAYPTGSFGGSAAPEPATLLGAGALSALAAGWLRRRRRGA